MKAHELARLLLELPDAEVVIKQDYTGQYSTVNSVSYGPEQQHSTGEMVKDENGEELEFVKID